MLTADQNKHRANAICVIHFLKEREDVEIWKIFLRDPFIH